MTAEQIEFIIKIGSGVISVITSLLAILAAIKGGKWKGLFKNVSAVNHKTQVLINFIEEAEDHGNWNGKDKLQYVLSKYIVYCTENKIKYDEPSVTEEINKLIELSNKVNSNKENKKLDY